jgi:hypothetical protein
MNITTHRRVARFAGLLLLSLLVFAIGVQTALATEVSGSGAGSGAAAKAAAGTQGRGGVAVASITPAQPQALTAVQSHHYLGGNYNGRFQPVSNTLAAQTASPSSTSTSAWIAAGSAAAIVLVGFAAWALMRRRRQPGERPSAAYCAQHPEDALCTAA